MSEWTTQDFEARRAAHRRGHGVPMRNRAAVDRAYDAVVSSIVSVSVTAFVSDGVLTNDNIDDAIDAAFASAAAAAGTDMLQRTFTVTVPAGEWQLSRKHVFPNFNTYRYAVGFEGAGRDRTVFRVNSDAEGSAVFQWGSGEDVTDGIAFSMSLRVRGFSVYADADNGICNRTGLRIYASVNAIIEDISIRGLWSPDCTYEQGRGIEILPGLENGVPMNSQFPKIRDCEIYACMLGIYVEGCYPLHIENTFSQGCRFRNAVFTSTASMEWSGGGIQGGGDPNSVAAFPWWSGNCIAPVVTTGWDRTAGLGSGTGATCSVATNGVCTVTGLSGLDFLLDRGRWLELTPAGNSANELLVRGMYQIAEVLSATSCTIWKGSNHTEQEDLAWQVRESSSCDLLFRDIYYEGHAVAAFGAYKDNNQGTKIVLDHCRSGGSGYTLDARSVGTVVERACTHGSLALRLHNVSNTDSDSRLDQIEFDENSYFGLRCAVLNHGSSFATSRRDGGGGYSKRVRSLVKEFGAVEAWDARLPDSLTLDGTDVEAWTGYINGSDLAPDTARFPVYTAADAEFAGPCVSTIGGAAGVYAGLRGVIDGDLWPDKPRVETPFPAIFVVFRLPDGVQASAQGRSLKCYDPVTEYGTELRFNDGQWSTDYAFYGGARDGGFEYTQHVAAADADDAPHAWVQNVGYSDSAQGVLRGSLDYPSSFYNGTGYGSRGFPFNKIPAGSDMRVDIGILSDATVDALHIAFLAVFPQPLTAAQHEQLIDAARNEWPLID